MTQLTDITNNFEPLYHPVSALVVYEIKDGNKDVYVEHFDMDKNGNPINAHPLTVREATALATALNINKEENHAFLKPRGILPTHVLHIDPGQKGAVLWYTKAQQRLLFFVQSLGIPNGKASVPAMVWLANRDSLYVFAVASDRRPREGTKLYYAPFFNVYNNGSVCLGTVDVKIKQSAYLEEFTAAWESYFFNSYFSYLVDEYNPIKGNCVSLWKDLVKTGSPFPKEVLKANKRTLKNLLQ